MKLAYQTITWGGVVGHPAGVTSVKDSYYMANGSTEEALQDISAAGYEGFELFEGNIVQYAGQEAEFEELTERLNLEFVAAYAGANFIYPEILGEELNKLENVAQLAARLGATHLVLGGGAVRSTGIQEDDYRLLGEGLEKAVSVSEKAGLVASYHPHLGSCVESPEQIEKLFQYTGINFCPDTAHLEAGGGDSAELISTYSDRIRYVHLKDYADGGFFPLGEGKMEFSQVLRSLKDARYDGWIAVELDSYGGDPKEAAETSKKFMDERW
jgi:inosose dehydratase